MSARSEAHETRWSQLAVEVAQELEHTEVGRTILRIMAEIEKDVPVGAQDGERIEGCEVMAAVYNNYGCLVLTVVLPQGRRDPHPSTITLILEEVNP